MPHCSARLMVLTLRLLYPALGRPGSRGVEPSAVLALTRVLRTVSLRRGEDFPLGRPYFLVPKVVRLQRQRCRALWFAVNGIDTGPRHICGVGAAI